ncbi:MAG: hypothetical protein K9G76_05560 [Bacteroidales bacterium]|nr:hypothetical protein [Bacteroidales bacterium]MCF8403147.1 hypothetical protein [Bacteroidales bacterium]
MRLNRKLLLNSLAILALIVIFQSCYYDNEEELYPDAGDCDTTNVTYSGTISIILAENCTSCHGGDFPQANIKVDNYNDLKTVVDNGRFWGAINHENGFSPMPKNLPQLNECNLKKIKIWIDNGALNN